MVHKDFAIMLRRAINQARQETGSNTPDFILADFLMDVLDAFDHAVNRREEYVGRNRSYIPEGDISYCVNREEENLFAPWR